MWTSTFSSDDVLSENWTLIFWPISPIVFNIILIILLLLNAETINLYKTLTILYHKLLHIIDVMHTDNLFTHSFPEIISLNKKLYLFVMYNIIYLQSWVKIFEQWVLSVCVFNWFLQLMEFAIVLSNLRINGTIKYFPTNNRNYC